MNSIFLFISNAIIYLQIKCNLIKKFSILFLLQIDYIICKQYAIQLSMPCEFPSPKLLQFSQLCQFDYHQVNFLF